MIECEICLEEYQEGDLERHQAMCVVRLMFRCSLCDEDYVSKEGLWNHLDLHEIVDESKGLHYQEIKAKHKLHQCVLCNNQRAYSESSYWKHVHDVHDGYFRSEKLKNDHASSHCKARDQTVASDFSALEEEQIQIVVENMTSDAEHSKLSREEQDSNANEGPDNRLSEPSGVNLNTSDDTDDNIIDQESKVPTINSTRMKKLPQRFACDICGITFSSKYAHLRHKKSKNSCLKGRLHNCPHCRRKFLINEYQAHLSLCEKKKFPCELCPYKFEHLKNLVMHMRNVHRDKQVLKNEKQDQNQVKNTLRKAVNYSRETTKSSDPGTLGSISESSSSSNVVEDIVISVAKKDIADDSVQLLVESQSSTPSGTKCDHCGKECTSATILRVHLAKTHLPTKCSNCGIIFQGYSSAHYHKIMKHTQPQYECVRCSKKYHSIKDYQRHSNECNPVQSDKGASELILKEKSDPKVTPENPSSEPSRTKCSYCGIEVSSAVTLARHILVHHDTASCTKCSYCGMEESNAVTLARHILMHHDPVACDFCGITVTSLTQAQHHMQTMHEESTLKCPHCSMQISSEGRLQKHVSKCQNWKVPCECCGKMFKTVKGVSDHKRKSCRAYKRSEEQGQKTAEASLCEKTDSPCVMEQISPPHLAECGIPKTRCYYCSEELSSPGYLNHHLKVRHELTKCDICGITVIGLSQTKNHKLKYHLEPKNECPTCGEKFHLKIDFHAHYSACEHKRYLCKLCGSTFQQLNLFNRHYKKSHPHERSLKIFEIVQDRKQGPNNALQMEITAEETAILAPSSTTDASNSRPNEHSLANLNDDDNMDSQGIVKESPMVSVVPLHGSSEEQVVSEKTSQPRVGNLSNHPYSCNFCGITLDRPSEVTYHRLTCPNAKKQDDSQFGAEEISLLHDVKETQTNSTIVPQGENVELKLEIKAEETMLQEQAYQVPNEDPGRSVTALLTCPKYTEGHDDSQFDEEEISLTHGVKQAQPNATVLQDENIELQLEIKVEETMLQEQEYQVPNEGPERSFSNMHPHDGKSRDAEAEAAEVLKNEIKVKEEYPEDEEEIVAEHRSTTESAQCLEVPSDRSESLARHEVMDVHSEVAHTHRRKQSSDCTDPRRSKRIRLTDGT